MTGREAISYIHSYHWQGSRPGLDRTRELLERMDHPEQALKFVHVVGTNGKGSTAAMLASILQTAGYMTGLYTSPYLSQFRERIRVNGAPISDEALGEVTDFVRFCASRMAEHPTEFELVTCIALEYYRRKKCRIVVLEAGMGGRLDSTNAIPAPEAVVLTRIGLDHTAQLGDTLEAIALEKAAVIKPGTRVVAYDQQPSVMEVFKTACHQTGVRMDRADFRRLAVCSDDLTGQVFAYGGWSGLHISLLGPHQRNNAAVVLETVQVMRERGWKISDEAVYQGLELARWPGRFELVSQTPRFLVDGGHNPQCAEAVAESLNNYFPGERVVFLIGVLADKDYLGLTARLAPLARSFITVTPDSNRALSAAVLGKVLKETYHLPVMVCASVQEGIETAQKEAGPQGLVCCVGSLYLAGEARSCFGLS